MTKESAIYGFLSGFGISAYEESSVPTDAQFPYLTYSPTLDYIGTETTLQVNLWYRSESNAIPNAKAAQIGDTVGLGGVMVSYDNGAVLIRRGSPFCQSMTDESDAGIKRRYINLTTEFLTA